MNIRTIIATLVAIPLLAPAASAGVIYGESFEAGATPFGWTLTGLWQVNSCFSKDGSYGLNYDRPNLGCTYDAGSTSGLATLPPFTVATPMYLTFDSYIDTEYPEDWSGCGYDVANVVVSTDGGATWTTVEANVQCGPQDVWTFHGINLSAFNGQTIVIGFSFNTIDSYANNHGGWSIDNVILTDESPLLPELSTLGLMAAGVGMVGFVALRRRN